MMELKELKENIDISTVWQRYSAHRNDNDRNEIVIYYLHIVKSIVYRMVPSYSSYVDTDDLMSCGVMGLIDAVSRFDAEKKVDFVTYAYWRIKGEIIDYLRKQDFISASARHKIKSVDSAFSAIEAKTGRTATEEEVCAYLNIDIKELRKILENAYTYNLVYLDELIENSGEEPVTKHIHDMPEYASEKKETLRILAHGIDELPEREKTVITLYYYEEMTLKEIGAVLNVTESRISQIHSKALFHLKNKFII